MEAKITKKQISNLLKDRRMELDMKASEVVQKLRVLYDIELSDKTLYGYENGVSSPNIPTFLAICKVYEIEDVIGALGQTKTRRRSLTATEERLVQYFRAASPELQDAALRMLRPEEKKQSPPPEG